MLSLIFLVRNVVVSVSFGKTTDFAGTRSTSSKVSPSPKNLLELVAAGDFFIAIGKDKENYNWTKVGSEKRLLTMDDSEVSMLLKSSILSAI